MLQFPKEFSKKEGILLAERSVVRCCFAFALHHALHYNVKCIMAALSHIRHTLRMHCLALPCFHKALSLGMGSHAGANVTTAEPSQAMPAKLSILLECKHGKALS